LDRLETESGRIECAPDLLLAEPRSPARFARRRAAAGALLLIGRREVRSNNSWMHNAPR
jgi:hypothetical protein